MMSMADHVAIGMETLMIDSVYSMEKELTELIFLKPRMIIILNYKWLGMWSFD